MTLFLTTANQFNAEKGGRGGESLTISLLLLFFRHLNKAAERGPIGGDQQEMSRLSVNQPQAGKS